MALDIAELFSLSVPPLELMIRGSAMYWFLFVLFRFVMRRDVGSIGIADVLLLVLIADAAQNAMAGGYESITDGFILVATIAGWNYLLDWAAFRFDRVRSIVEPSPLLLVRDGQLQGRNLRRERLSVEELKSELRRQGMEDWSGVKKAFMESDGQISVIKLKSGESQKPRKRPPTL
ncbi:MAG: DUF421 domain-containing protein [Methylibium sp.]|uniref:DUF421 domain-containing protein n=1 Tax=Methylibium sp. TaxID=2067992 RepID=UPI0017C7E875|nr:YetF domain-containing protein [Methylibium sp.]MBA3596654.1 DUF421 domain-containing protein [Methylibium sp.]